MNRYKCMVSPHFKQMTLLKAFLLDEIEICYSNMISQAEIEFYNGHAREKIVWDKLCGYFYEQAEQYYLKNYDYYFLQNALIEAGKCETIVVGSSYARFGIEESLYKKRAKNLGLPSQDIYYASKIVKQIIELNYGVKDVFIGCSYYYFYSDVSRSRMEAERKQVSDIYYPIFGDLHNSMFLRKTDEFEKSSIFDVERIMKLIINELSNGMEYFSLFRSRESMKIGEWEPAECHWKDVEQEEKNRVAEIRADAHNKCIKYKESYKENIEILNELVNECNEREIRLWVVALPMSESYKKYFNPEFKLDFYRALNSIEGEIHLIDFNDIGIFIDEDFNDADHLSEKGAAKVTEVINQICEKASNIIMRRL